MSCRAMKYFQAVKIRGHDISKGGELKGNFLVEKRERANYAALDYMQRLEIIEDAAGETNGVLVEWEAVRIADSGTRHC